MKEAYYFSHDSNARHDPKITAMRGVYGPEGYAWFWILVEMMRESEDYKLEMRSKYAYHAFASQMQCDPEKAQEFIRDCIHEFGLFKSDETYFWSVSLLKRMAKKDKKSESARKSANARWNKEPAPDKDFLVGNMRTHIEGNANAYANATESDASKVKESKGKEIKEDIKPLCGSPPAEPVAQKYPVDFERFWTVFPETRRKDKAKTFKTWQKKITAGERELLIRCTILYSQDFKTIGLHSEWAKMPTTYLNAGTYKDYLKEGEQNGYQGHESDGGRQEFASEYDQFGPPPPEPPNYRSYYDGGISRNGENGRSGSSKEAPSDDDLFVRR